MDGTHNAWREAAAVAGRRCRRRRSRRRSGEPGSSWSPSPAVPLLGDAGCPPPGACRRQGRAGPVAEGAAAGPCFCPVSPGRGLGCRQPSSFGSRPGEGDGAGRAAGTPQGSRGGRGFGPLKRREATRRRFLPLPGRWRAAGRRLEPQGRLRLLLSRGERGVRRLPPAPSAGGWPPAAGGVEEATGGSWGFGVGS